MRSELLRQPALADPGLARQQEQAALAGEHLFETLEQLGELGSAPDEGTPAGWGARRGTRRRSGFELQPGILLEDRLLELAQLTAGLDPELLDKGGARLGVRVECLGLTAGAIQRQHELGPGTLAQRLLPHQGAQATDELLVLAELDTRRDPFLERCQPELLEPAYLCLAERLIGQVRQRRPAPVRERLAEQLASLARRAAGQRPSAAFSERLEALGVDPLGVGEEPVAGRARDQQPAGRAGLTCGLEGPPQARNRHLQRPRRIVAPLAGPQLLDQPVARDNLAGVEQEHPEQSALSCAAEGKRPVTVDHFDRAEDAEVHRSSPSPNLTRWCLESGL